MAQYLIPNNFIKPADCEPRTATTRIPLINCRVWDAVMTGIPTSAATDDIGITAGTWATAAPKLTGGDVKATSSSRFTRFQYVIPEGFDVLSPSLTLRINCGMETTVSDTSCTIDAVVYENVLSVIGSDLCTTAAQSMNSLTASNKDFTIASAGLVAGDILDVRLNITYVDAATATAVTPAIFGVSLVSSVRS